MSRAKKELHESYPSGYQFCLISYFAMPHDREVALHLLNVLTKKTAVIAISGPRK
jgi:hypothetical protein